MFGSKSCAALTEENSVLRERLRKMESTFAMLPEIYAAMNDLIAAVNKQSDNVVALATEIHHQSQTAQMLHTFLAEQFDALPGERPLERTAGRTKKAN